MNNDYLKTYKFILEDKSLDLGESILLCLYLEKFFYHNGCVIASDEKDSESLKMDRKSVGRKRKHLQEIGYIKCYTEKGKPCMIQINESVVNKAKEINDNLNKSNKN